MSDDSTSKKLGRRRVLKGLGAASAALAFPHVWIPRPAFAQSTANGTVRHLVYIRLSGGFRFSCAFNGDVADQFNPFGPAGQRANGTEWGVSSLLERSDTWLAGDANEARRTLGMRPVNQLSNEMCVLPSVDHEPFSNRADGNHGTGLERFLTGYVGGSTSFLTYLNWGLRQRVAEAQAQGRTLLPAFSLGDAGMALGAGEYAAFRAPVLEGDSFDRFGFDPSATLPEWASTLAANVDQRMQERLHKLHREQVQAYRGTREATATYGRIFNDALLKVGNRSNEQVDGISNQELETLFGTGGAGRRAALGLRLFHFGCPAVFLNEGGYDMHSDEDDSLPLAMENLNRVVSGLEAALKRMTHPEGGTYWERTLVVLG
ncbi:MAG: DUF1501 domain-containing protein, partial [Myxococcaceae bacterium]|nr:DUF1501 domain-containing protein [Myxococcaceae bacterium]